MLMVPSMHGFVGAVAISAFDPINSDSSHITFSNNNLTVANIGNNNTGGPSVRGTKSQNSGRYYFEVMLTALGTYYLDCVGVVNPSFTDWTAALGNDSSGNSVGIRETIPPHYILAFQGTINPTLSIGIAPTAGDVIGVAVDWVSSPGNTWVSFRVNGLWGNAGNLDPTLSAADYVLAGGQTFYPATTVAGSTTGTSIHTLNVGVTAFANPLPPGYIAWG